MKEKFIIVIDDKNGYEFEYIHWCDSKKTAMELFNINKEEHIYPDEEDRHLRVFQEIASSDNGGER